MFKKTNLREPETIDISDKSKSKKISDYRVTVELSGDVIMTLQNLMSTVAKHGYLKEVMLLVGPEKFLETVQFISNQNIDILKLVGYDTKDIEEAKQKLKEYL